METVIYLIAGFLESGKTTFINEIMGDPNFFQGEKTVILCCEEGFTEYNEDRLRETQTTVIPVENEADLTGSFLKDLNAKYRPERVIIEFNGTWSIQKLFEVKKPKNWVLGQVVAIANSETFKSYVNNMRTMIADSFRQADTVIFNRCTPETDKASFRRIARSINPRAELMFDNVDGTVDDGRSEGDRPYDLNADVIQIADEDFGIWYLDAIETPDRYDGKLVRVKGMAFHPRAARKDGVFVLGRFAMTCCAEDISAIGFVCKADGEIPAEKQWFDVIARVKKGYSPLHKREAVLLHLKKFKAAKKPEEELVYFN